MEASERRVAGREGSRHESGFCQVCGLQADRKWLEPLRFGKNLNGAGGSTGVACLLCQLPLHLERPRIDLEAALIWLPEMTQADLNTLVLGVHLLARKHGAGLDFAKWPVEPNEDLSAARSIDVALRERAQVLEQRMGTSSAGDLGEAVFELTKKARSARGKFLDGVRLLSRGHFFRGDVDVYPDFIGELVERGGKLA